MKYDRGVLCRDVTVQLIRALALAQLNDKDAARAGLAASRIAVENQASGFHVKSSRWEGFWFDWAVARILLREADDLIGDDSDVPE